MDSSDSEDDCYGNIAQKLQRMKNRYNEDEKQSTNLLDDSAEINEIVKNANKTTKIESKTNPKQKNSDDYIGIDAEDSVILDNIIATSKKRVTRSSSKRASSDTQITQTPLPKKSKRRKKTADVPVSDSNSSKSEQTSQNVAQTSQNVAQTSQNANQTSQNANQTSQNVNQPSRDVNPVRGRGTSRGRSRGRGRNYWQSFTNNCNIPIYSVGNTDEYPDQSDNQQLFSSKKPTNDVILIEENEALDENEELSVKVYWQSSEFFKFTIRRFQKLSQIFDYFSKKENVSNDKLFFTYNDRILKPDDTPDSIDYRFVKFIDGGIVNQSVSSLIKNDSKKARDGIIIKFQCQNVKKPYETRISLDDKLSIAMMKCAEHFETALDKLKFQFDGDAISGKNTARDLDLEGGECIDVKIIS